MIIVLMVERLADVEISRIYKEEFSDRSDELKKKYGLADDEYFAIDGRPPEVVKFDEKYKTRTDGVMHEYFLMNNENGIAELSLNDKKEFDRKREVCRHAMFGGDLNLDN